MRRLGFLGHRKCGAVWLEHSAQTEAELKTLEETGRHRLFQRERSVCSVPLTAVGDTRCILRARCIEVFEGHFGVEQVMFWEAIGDEFPAKR